MNGSEKRFGVDLANPSIHIDNPMLDQLQTGAPIIVKLGGNYEPGTRLAAMNRPGMTVEVVARLGMDYTIKLVAGGDSRP